MRDFLKKQNRSAKSFDQIDKLTNTSRSRRDPESEAHDHPTQGLPRGDEYPLKYALFLPLFAEVIEVNDRGFGFAESAPDDQLFFHVTAGVRGENFEALESGDTILAIVGSDPKRPRRRAIVRWVSTSRIAWDEQAPENQSSWDAMRRARLDSRLRQLEKELRPNWYVRKWEPDHAPSDLEDDLLRELVLDRIGRMDLEQLQKLDLRRLSDSALYSFAACLDTKQPDALNLLNHVPEEDLPLLGRPSPSLLAHATGAQRAEVVKWYVRAGGAERVGQERDAMLTGRTPWEAKAASQLLASQPPQGTGFLRWLLALREEDLLPDGFADSLADVQGIHALRYAELLSDKVRDALFRKTVATANERTEAVSLRPDLAVDLACRMALAIDLETDGHKVWQIGIANTQGGHLLLDGGGPKERSAAFEALRQQLPDAPIVVGHNILVWDVPVLEKYGFNLGATGLFWDTLLVEVLLDPAATSHALGGTHRADTDALDAFDLFRRQLQRLPESFATSLLTDPPSTNVGLIERIAQALDGVPLEPAPIPPWVNDSAPDLDRPVIAPRHAIDSLAWASGVAVIQAPGCEALPVDLLVVDANALREDPEFDHATDPRAAVILALAERCKAAGIPLRVAMLPPWLVEGSLHSAVSRAARPTEMTGKKVCLLPPAGHWWDNFDARSLRVLSWSGQVRLIPAPPTTTNSSQIGSVPPKTAIWAEDTYRWALPDPAAARLDVSPSPRRFGAVSLPAEAVAPPGLPSKTLVPLVPERTAFRAGPGGFDSASYWTEVIGEVIGLAEEGEIRALLVGSSGSQALRSLIETAVAEIGQGEVKAAHVSRREHLKRASRINGVVVLFAREWREWHRLAEEQDIVLRPIIEALPVEEWHVLAQGTAEVIEKSPDPITSAEIAAGLVKGARVSLDAWLQESGLADARVVPVLLDPRAAELVRPLKSQLAARPPLPPLDADTRRKVAAVLEPLAVRREPAPSDLVSMEAFLVSHWQPPSGKGNAVTGFKDTQRLAMAAILRRREDVIVTLPTGEGKSVLFQVPALCRGLCHRRLTLVLSPLRALMRDQVERLRLQGFDASVDYLNADRPAHEKSEILEGVLDHRIVLLYVAPERLRDPVFSDVLRRRVAADAGLERLVLDEAHCLNQWGFEFRPDYFFAVKEVLRLSEAPSGLDVSEFDTGISRDPQSLAQEPAAPVLMLSATHTAADRDALAEILHTARGPDHDIPVVPVPPTDTQPHPLRAHIKVQTEQVQHPILGRKDFEKGLAERMPHLVAAVDAARANRVRTGQRSGVLIFVTRRAHAEAVATAIAKQTGAASEAFHAGLSAGLREELVEDFREGIIDVLVATKAFGMGMDIPDIHYVVHLSPPAYLEDYLQEVGRTGRGTLERRAADLEQLPATLLWSPDDFAVARDLRKKNEVTQASIRNFHVDLRNRATGDRVLVPTHGFETYTSDGHKRALETRCRMSLHWLENAKRLKIVSLVQNSVLVKLHTDTLRRIEQEENATGRVAGELLTLLGVEGFVDRVQENKLILDLGNLSRTCGHSGTDETVARLAELQKRRALEIDWVLSARRLKLWKQPPELTEILLRTVELGIDRVIELATETGVEIDPDTLMEELGVAQEAEESAFAKASEQDRSYFLEAWLWAVKSLALSCAVSLRQVRLKEGLAWRIRLPSAQRRMAHRRAERLLRSARELIELARAKSGDQVSVNTGALVEMLKEIHQEFRTRDLDATLRLLSALRQLAFQEDLLPSHYEVELLDDGIGLDNHPELAKRLASVNALAEARLIVMEAFCCIPEAARDEFIREYMTCRDAIEIEAFLVQQLGSTAGADSDLSEFAGDLLRRYRGEAVKEHFARFETSEEPAQWTAIAHPYDRPMLVNAGPGAGKTAVLVARIVHLLHVQGLKPAEILVLAFNRAVVQEIRSRVAAVFRDLGYGAYTRDLRVRTFHSLAMRHLPEELRGKGENVIQNLNDRLHNDATFAAEIAMGCRSILVDEFQDANDAIFGIISNLAKASRAGVFAIGDDDQDITRWNRSNGEFSEIYFERFKQTFETQPDELTTLAVNFRSGHEIVVQSQRALATLLRHNPVSTRLKRSTLRARADAPPGNWQVRDCRGREWDDLVADVQRELSNFPKDRSLAILCRSNADVDLLLKPLKSVLPDLKIQKRSEISDYAECRHVGLWLDLLDHRVAEADDAASPALRDALLDTFQNSVRIPETKTGSEEIQDLSALWNSVLEEDPDARLSDVAGFLRGKLRIDDVDRIVGRGAPRILSTIHKVKGLQFDEVIVMPSNATFPMGEDEPAQAAAEEARVLYVAGTRAKERLLRLHGDREAAWFANPPRCSGNRDERRFLKGNPAEIDLGWTADGRGFNSDPAGLHKYIEEHVAVGDQIAVGGRGGGAGRALFHVDAEGRRTQVGFLAQRSGAAGLRADLRVAAVIRFFPDTPPLWANGHAWTYAVLVEGRLC